MVSASVENAIQSLKAERDRLDAAIASLEGLRTGDVGAVRRGPGRPVGPQSTRDGERKRKNAPKGLLKLKIHQVLKAAKKPLAPVELRNLVIKAGYPSKNLKTLYTAIFAAAKRDPAVKKTSSGFSLK
jgi:hypothetical protein